MISPIVEMTKSYFKKGYTTNCVGKNFLPQITQIWTNFKFKNLIILILGFDTGIFELI